MRVNSAIFAPPASSSTGQAPGASTDAGTFDLLWAQLALIGITISVCNAIVYYPLRLGLTTPPLLIPCCALIVAVALLAPLLLPYRGLLADRACRSVAMPILSLLVMAGVVLALLLGRFLLIVYVPLFLAGGWRAMQLLRKQSRLQLVFSLCAGFITGLYLFGTVQSMNYAGLYSPEQSLLGTLNHDTVFHSAIAFLIQNFGVPSLGLDGMIPIKYHFGSHFWMAGLGRLTASEPVFSYGAAVPIVFAPMLVAAFLLSAAAIDRGRKSLPVYVLIGLGLILLSDTIGWNSYYISESYTCALIGLLLLLPLLAFAAGETPPPSRQLRFAFVVAIVMIPLLFVSKVSVGALWTAALGTVILRRYGFSKQGLLTGLAAGIVFLVMFKVLSPSTGDYQVLSTNAIIPFFFFRIAGPISISSLVLPVLFLFSKTRLYGGPGLRTVFSTRSDLMFEATMVVLVLGVIPPIAGVPQDSAVWYFINVSQWITMALFTARLAPAGFTAPAPVLIWRAFPVIALAAGLALTLVPRVYKQAISVAQDADRMSNGQLLHGHSARFFYNSLVHEHVLWGSEFRRIADENAGAQLAQAARHAIPGPDRKIAIFVAPQNKAFWSRAATCHYKYNVQVSLTGQPSLLGNPPGCGPDAYTANYGPQTGSRDISDADLCVHARQRNLQRVLIVADSRPSDRNRVLDCSVSGAN